MNIVSPKQNAGFTLVEMAIVLTIIALIVGGVLTGQDLIKSSQIRGTVTQMEKYNAAANTFRGKFHGYPGDISNIKAVEYGFNTAQNDAGRDGTSGKGDSNSMVEGCSASAAALGCETMLFWLDLQKAGMINGETNLTSITGVLQASKTNLELQKLLPPTRLRENSLYTVFTNGSRNFYGIGALATTASGGYNGLPGLTPLEARGIDDKMDDGTPTTGSVTAVMTDLVTPDIPAASDACISPTEGYLSNTDANLHSITCSLSIYSSF